MSDSAWRALPAGKRRIRRETNTARRAPSTVLPTPVLAVALLAAALAACHRDPTPRHNSTPPADAMAQDDLAPPLPPAVLPITTRPQIDLSQHPLRYRDCNLIWVSLDALQAAHVGHLGNRRDVTPTLDQLAERSCVFTQLHSVASWTVPSSMSWFTGVYPTQHRITNKFAVFRDDERVTARLQDQSPELTTLADVLRKSGYATAGFTGNAGVSGRFGFSQGFDLYWHEDGKFGGLASSMPKAIAWLREQATESRKFFLFLHGYDCHAQYPPNDGFDYRFVEKSYDGRYTGAPREQETLREEGLERGQLSLRLADVQFWRAIYDERIQRADEHLRQFLADLEQLGLLDSTILVVTSDHGTEYYEHRRLDHGFTLYEEQLRVPLLIALPDQTGCRAVTERISSLDLMPTLLELLDVTPAAPLESQMQGRSLVGLLRGESLPRDIISETDYRAYTYQRSIIDPDGWKLIYTLESRRRELYDLTADPLERHDLATRESPRADALEERLFGFYRKLGHDLRSRRWERGLNPVYDSQMP